MKKQTPPPQTSGNEGYGYGNYGNYGYGAYSGYYYGYGYGSGGYGGGGEPAPARTLHDYMLVLRERIWYLIVTFFVIFVAFALYALNKTPEFVSEATVQVFREQREYVQGTNDPTQRVVSPEDFNTRLRLMESISLTTAVEQRLSPPERSRLVLPYENGFSFLQQSNPLKILHSQRYVSPVRTSLLIKVGFQHPDRDIAAIVANLYAEEFIRQAQVQLATGASVAVEQLQTRAAQQKKKVEDLQEQMREMVAKYGLVSLKKDSNIQGQQLIQLNTLVTEKESVLQAAKTRWDQVQKQKAEGKPLWISPSSPNRPASARCSANMANTRCHLRT